MSIKIKLYICVVFAFLFYSCASIKNETFLVGTYSENSNQGINVIDFNAKNNSLTLKKVITGVENPSFVVTNRAKTIVVTVEEIASIDGGKVTSFTYNSKYGTFKKVNSCFTKGNHPCTVAFSKDEKHILVGNYSGGNLGVFPIDKLGNLSEIKELIQHEGKSINTNRQEKAHVHSIVLHPSENKIFVTDLGTDEIEIIPTDENPKTILQKQHAIICKVPAGSGPRHLVFNKKGTKAYVTFELTNQIGVFNYINKVLTFEKTINLTTDETKNGSAAEIRLSKDENFLYASVRGNDNFIAVIELGNEMKVMQRMATNKCPRNFILTKDEQHILVANQLSNTVTIFDRNIKTGLLTATSAEVLINKPVYLCRF